MTLYIKNNLIKIFIFYSLIIIENNLQKYSFKYHPFYLPHKKSILSLNKSKINELEKGRIFLDKCLISKKNKKYKKIKKPKLSVILPLYNCQKTIRASLNSIIFQNMANIEIILINDFSNDNTLKIIKNFKRYDQRIMLINNKKNMGTLYSRSIGVLKAKGDYIFSLDNDDMYFDYDVLGYIYQRITQESLDIIGFLTINLWNYTASINKMKNIFTYLYPDEFYLEQPELRTWMIKFKGKYLVHNNMIWDKCIKSLIYKKALNIMGYNRYSNYLSWAEDTSILFIIFNLAKSFKYIYKYGILHFKGNITSSLTQSIDTKIFGEIFFLDILNTFSKNNTEDKNLIVGQAYYIYNRYNISSYLNTSNRFYLKSTLIKIINCNYLSNLNRRKIKKLFRSFFIY